MDPSQVQIHDSWKTVLWDQFESPYFDGIKSALKQEKSKKKDRQVAEVILHLPGTTLTAKEATLNMYAAIDIVEAKLKNQLKKYKEKHDSHRADRKGVLQRFRKIADRDHRGSQN